MTKRRDRPLRPAVSATSVAGVQYYAPGSPRRGGREGDTREGGEGKSSVITPLSLKQALMHQAPVATVLSRLSREGIFGVW